MRTLPLCLVMLLAVGSVFAQVEAADEDSVERVYAGEDFAPLVAAFDSLFVLTEQFISDLENSVDASSVEAAIRLYTAAMGQLRAEIMRIAEADPGLVSSQEIPPEMMASLERLNGLNARLQEVGPAVAQYENDPGVVDALKGFEGMDF